MPGFYAPDGRFSATLNGAPLVGGKLYTYIAGTTTPAPTYLDTGLAGANTNPVILDSQGRATVILDDAIAYDFALRAADESPVWTADDLVSPNAGLAVERAERIAGDEAATAVATAAGAAAAAAQTNAAAAMAIESAARIAADGAEATARTNADASLQTQINNLNSTGIGGCTLWGGAQSNIAANGSIYDTVFDANSGNAWRVGNTITIPTAAIPANTRMDIEAGFVMRNAFYGTPANAFETRVFIVLNGSAVSASPMNTLNQGASISNRGPYKQCLVRTSVICSPGDVIKLQFSLTNNSDEAEYSDQYLKVKAAT